MDKTHIDNPIPEIEPLKENISYVENNYDNIEFETREACMQWAISSISQVPYQEIKFNKSNEKNNSVCSMTRNELKDIVRQFINIYDYLKPDLIEKSADAIEYTIGKILKNDDILSILSDLKHVDDYTFEHSVNVCIISVIIGTALNYSDDSLHELGTGALLHDIGKLYVPKELLKKPSKLTNEEFNKIKMHTVLGFRILRNKSYLSPDAAFIALAHHERCDGSGYPLKIIGDNIHKYARIAAIADVYDALTSDRVYRKKLKHQDAFEYITRLNSCCFDKEIVSAFTKNIITFPKK